MLLFLPKTCSYLVSKVENRESFLPIRIIVCLSQSSENNTRRYKTLKYQTETQGRCNLEKHEEAESYLCQAQFILDIQTTI